MRSRFRYCFGPLVVSNHDRGHPEAPTTGLVAVLRGRRRLGASPLDIRSRLRYRFGPLVCSHLERESPVAPTNGLVAVLLSRGRLGAILVGLLGRGRLVAFLGL